jgi:hypothetical protein
MQHRADHDRSSLVEDGEKALGLVDRRREIGVAEQDAAAPGQLEAGLEGVSLAVVRRVARRRDGDREERRERADRLERPVGTAVVHDDDLGLVRLLREVAADRRQRHVEPLGLVERGDDDGEIDGRFAAHG